MIITEACDAIFTPTMGAAARLVMTEVIPGSPIRTIILADRSPLTLAQVGSPEPPECHLPIVSLFQSLLLLHIEVLTKLGPFIRQKCMRLSSPPRKSRKKVLKESWSRVVCELSDDVIFCSIASRNNDATGSQFRAFPLNARAVLPAIKRTERDSPMSAFLGWPD
jgi:hypothetical protein